jgi:glucokinase
VHCVIGLDVGGTVMKAALTAEDSTVLHTDRRPTPRDQGPDAVVAALVDFAADLVASATDRNLPPRAVGVAVPGIIDETGGTAVFSANIGWRDAPLAKLVAERTALPVALGHDVRAGGVAEARLGAGRGNRQFLFLTIGTGIAGAIVINGRALPGAHGGAGEVGHLVVRPDGEACPCDSAGCLETLASGASIARRYAERHRSAAGRSGVPLTAAEIAGRFAGGDPDAAEIWRDAVDALADALAQVTILLDPGLVVIGGGVGDAGETLLSPLRTALSERLTFSQAPRLVRAELGDAAGSLGAALLGWDLFGYGDVGDSGREPVMSERSEGRA